MKGRVMKQDELRRALLLYAVTDGTWVKEGSALLNDVETALRAGATFLQLREKSEAHPLAPDELLREAVAMGELARRYNVPYVIDDDVGLAIQCGADGVHVGQSDMAAKNVRALIGKDKILGVSAQTAEQALLAQSQGADYLGVGAVFPTGTKTDADAVSLETLKRICEAVTIPVVAIGGISEKNISMLGGTGVCGAAVVSAIFAADDIALATKTLKEGLKGIV